MALPVGFAQHRSGTEHVADRDHTPEHRGGVLVHWIQSLLRL
jgi:hypothetical protein